MEEFCLEELVTVAQYSANHDWEINIIEREEIRTIE